MQEWFLIVPLWKENETDAQDYRISGRVSSLVQWNKNTWVVLEMIFMTETQNDFTDENVFWQHIIVYNFLHDIFQPYAATGVFAIDCAVWQASIIRCWNDPRWKMVHKTWQLKCKNLNDPIFPLKQHAHIMSSSMQSKVKCVSCWTVGAVTLSVST